MNPTMNRREFLRLTFAAAGAAGVGLLTPEPALTEGDWQVLNPSNPPSARSGHSMVTLPDGKVVLFGGEDDAQNIYNDLFAYDSGQWSPISVVNTPPEERKNQCAWFFDGTVYIHGGVGKNARHLDDLWTYDPQKREWVEKPVSGNKPSPRKYHAAAVGSNGVYIAGGIDANSIGLDDVWRYDGSGFTPLGHLQQSVGTPQAHWVDDVLWLFGNYNGNVVTYNLSNNTSSVRTGGPPAMNCTSALWDGPQEKLIFIFGGLKGFPLSESLMVYEYDVKTGTTRVREELMPFANYNGACAKLNPPSYGHASTPTATPPVTEVLFFGGKSGGACINTTFKFSLRRGAKIYLPLVMRNF